MAKAHTLVDNFNDDAIDGTKWTVAATPFVREINGRVEIRPPGNRANSYFQYGSAARYDLTGSEVRVQLLQPLTQLPGAPTYLTASPGPNSWVYITITGGMLRCGFTVSGVETTLAEVAYDAACQRWLRIRERAGMLFWEVSPDATAWTTLASRSPHPFDLTSVSLAFGAGTNAPLAAPGMAVFDNFNVHETGIARRTEERRLSARAVRVQAADVAAERDHPEHASNNDEVNYPATPLAGSYSKSLRHDAVGDPDAASYASLLRALQSRDPADFEEIVLASPAALKLTNPQAGLAFDLEGPDAQAVTMPPAPRFDSAVTAHEAGELYWMAVARDVPFTAYGADPRIAAARASLEEEFPQFGGTVPVTPQNVFRGVYPGEQAGPYVSQFLLRGNVDPRKPAGFGRDATDGFVSYGARVIDQRLVPARAGRDYLELFQTWLNVQNGADRRGLDEFEEVRVFIRTLRDGATFVHFDQVIDAFYNAAWILMSEPTGNQLTNAARTGRPQVESEFPYDQGNPYMPPPTATRSRTQAGFATFGPTHLLQVLGDVLGRALRAVWWQKWGVHRRLRPEEFGGRVDNWIVGRRDYPIDPVIKTSLQTGRLSAYFGPGKTFASSYLLPQAYPEGAPTHPAYGAGHATGSGALITVLKAFFDDTAPVENPVQASADGLTLAPYTPQPGEAPLTVGGELNKLAGNIALFRNAAGVHWRSDYTDSLPLGEKVAIGLLQEMSLGFNEDDGFFELTRLDGVRIRIRDGVVSTV